PAQLVKVHDTQLQQPRLYQYTPQAFHLTKAGEALLKEIGFEPKPRNGSHFVHSLTQAQAQLSFKIGAKALGLDYQLIDVKPIEANGHKVVPDIGVVELGSGDRWRYSVVEIDCASEPLRASDKQRQAIQRKFAAYLSILDQRLYDSQWGLPGLWILFTTTT